MAKHFYLHLGLQVLLLTFWYDCRQAWKQLGDMEAEQAMQEYISCVNVLDPEGSTKVKGLNQRKHVNTNDSPEFYIDWVMYIALFMSF